MRAALMLALLLVSGCVQSGQESPAASSTDPAPPRMPRLVTADNQSAWSPRAEIPLERVEIGCIATADTIYAVGGFDQSGQSVARMDVYDIKSDTWSRAPDAPVAIHHTGLALRGNAFYVFGGYTGPLPFAGLSSVFRYDMDAKAWSVEAALPRPRGGHATIHAGNEVYLVGGSQSQPGSLYTVVDVYNLATKQWRQGPDATTARDHLAGGFAAGEILATGGRVFTLNSNMATTEALVLGADRWATRPDMPTDRGGLASVVVADMLYVFGGESSGGTFDEVEVYDAANQTWYGAPDMPMAVHAPCAAAAPDGIHIIGGGPQPAFTASKQHVVLDLVRLRRGA